MAKRELSTMPAAVFRLHSAAGDNGYPGALEATCTYRLRDDDVLVIEMTATTTAPTPVNLVNHTYWNLAGQGTVYGQLLEVELELRTVGTDRPRVRYLDVARSAECVPFG